jgi:hypothetical protein
MLAEQELMSEVRVQALVDELSEQLTRQASLPLPFDRLAFQRERNDCRHMPQDDDIVTASPILRHND